MSPFPIRRAMEDEIEARGGEDWVFGLFEQGMNVTSVAAEIGICGYGTLYRWLRSDPDRKQRFADMRAAQMAENVDELDGLFDKTLERTNISPARARVIAEKADHTRWKAERLSDEYRPQPAQVNVGIDLGALHLEFLKRRASVPGAEDRKAIAGEVLDAEYEDEEDDE